MNMDIRDIDPSTVVDIADVRIDITLPVEERVLSLLQRYFYRCGDNLVKTSFLGNDTLQNILEAYLEGPKL